MAKKATAPTKNETPPTSPDTGEKPAKKAGRPAGFSTKEGDVFVAVDPQPDPAKDTNAKVAPQAAAIANLVVAAGKTGITRKDLVANMDGVVQTRQPQGRILSYYQKLLVEKGYFTVTSPASEKKEEATKETAE